MQIESSDDGPTRAPHGPDEGGAVTTAGPVRVGSPVEMVAAVPYLLGFHPRDSLVLVSLADRQVALASRIDLPPRAKAAATARELAAVLAEQGCEEVLVVVVGGAPRSGSGSRGRPPRADLVAAVRAAFGAFGIPVSSAVWVPEIVAGATWLGYDSGARGTLPDPAASAVAAATVAAGHVTYPDREHLERLVAPAGPAALRRRSRLLEELCDRRCVAPDPGPDLGADAFALVWCWVGRAAAAEVELTDELTDEAVVALCVALSDPMVRDAAFGFAHGPLASGAERLWTALVRESPDPESAEAAVLLAHSALARGNGALVGIALERALRAWPAHRMSELLRSALDDGLGPDDLLGWFAEGAAEARRLLRRRAG